MTTSKGAAVSRTAASDDDLERPRRQGIVMSVDWDEVDPRAVVPPAHVLKSPHVLAASTEMAKASPYAFGLGISILARPPRPKQSDDEEGVDYYEGDDDDDFGCLPLYYVSKEVAKNRPEEVKEGWYVVADPGKAFEVTVSPLRGANSVRHTVAKADLIMTRLQVDGTYTDDHSVMVFDRFRTCQEWYAGFTQSEEYAAGRGRRRKYSVRRFQFYKAPTTDDDMKQTKLSPHAGKIRLHMESGSFEGTYVPKHRKKVGRKGAGTKANAGNEMSGTQEVHEEKAMKWGLSVGVKRDGMTIEKTSEDVKCKIRRRKKLPKTITIFVRERFWLESRRIIDLDGNPYRPPVRPDIPAAPVDIVDLNGVEESEDEAPVDIVDLDGVEESVDVKEETEDVAPMDVVDLDGVEESVNAKEESVEEEGVEKETVTEENVEEAGVEKETVKEENVEQEGVEQETVKEENVEEESVKEESMEEESMDDESVKEESVKEEDVVSGNVKLSICVVIQSDA